MQSLKNETSPSDVSSMTTEILWVKNHQYHHNTIMYEWVITGENWLINDNFFLWNIQLERVSENKEKVQHMYITMLLLHQPHTCTPTCKVDAPRARYTHLSLFALLQWFLKEEQSDLEVGSFLSRTVFHSEWGDPTTCIIELNWIESISTKDTHNQQLILWSK